MTPSSDVPPRASARLSRWLVFSSNLSLVYPLLLLALLYGQWLLSWAVLGHLPQPSIDDPKFIDGASWMHNLTGLVFWGLVPMVCIGMGLNALYIVKGRLRILFALRRGLLFVVLWFGTFLLLRLDPGSIFYWWMD